MPTRAITNNPDINLDNSKNLLLYGNALSTIGKTGVTSVDALSKATAGLTQAQAANILTSNNQILGYHKLNSVQMYNALVKGGMTKEEAKNTVATVLNTQATVSNTGAKKLNVVETIKQSWANITSAATYKALGLAIWDVTKALLAKSAAFLATPFGAVIATISTVVLSYNAWRSGIEAASKRLDEQRGKLNEAKSKFEELKGKIESTEQELSDVNSRISELQSLGTLSLVEQAELEKLQAVNRELMITKSLLEVEMSQAQNVMSKESEKLYKELGKTSDGWATVGKGLASAAAIAAGIVTILAGTGAAFTGVGIPVGLPAIGAGVALVGGGITGGIHTGTTEFSYRDKNLEDNLKNYEKYKDLIGATNDAKKEEKNLDKMREAETNIVEKMRGYQEVIAYLDAVEHKTEAQNLQLERSRSEYEKILQLISPATYSQIKFDQLVNLDGFEDVPKRLEKLGEESADKYREGVLGIIKLLPQEFKDSVGEGLSDEEIAIKIGFKLDALENLKTEIDKALGQSEDNIEKGIHLPITLELSKNIKVEYLEKAQQILTEVAEKNGEAAAQIKAQSISDIFAADGGKLVSNVQSIQSEYNNGKISVTDANNDIEKSFHKVFAESATEDLITFMQIFGLVPKAVTDGVNSMIGKIDKFQEKFDKLQSLEDKIKEGKSPTNKELLDLAKEGLIDWSDISSNNGVLSIDISAIKDSMDKIKHEYNIGYDEIKASLDKEYDDISKQISAGHKHLSDTEISELQNRSNAIQNQLIPLSDERKKELDKEFKDNEKLIKDKNKLLAKATTDAERDLLQSEISGINARQNAINNEKTVLSEGERQRLDTEYQAIKAKLEDNSQKLTADEIKNLREQQNAISEEKAKLGLLESSEILEPITSSLESFNKAIDEAQSEVGNLNNILSTLSKNQSLSADEVLDLIQKYPQLASKIKATADGYIIETDALEILRQARIDEHLTTIKSETDKTIQVLKDSHTRVEAYGVELSAIKDLETARAEANKVNPHADYQEGEGYNYYAEEARRKDAVEQILRIGDLKEQEQALLDLLNNRDLGVKDSKSSSKSTTIEKLLSASKLFEEQIKDLESSLIPINNKIKELQEELSKAQTLGDEDAIQNFNNLLIEAQQEQADVYYQMIRESEKFKEKISDTFSEFKDVEMTNFGVAKSNQELDNQITALENANATLEDGATKRNNEIAIRDLNAKKSRLNEYSNAYKTVNDNILAYNQKNSSLESDIFNTRFKENDRLSDLKLGRLKEVYERTSDEKALLSGVLDLLNAENITIAQKTKLQKEYNDALSNEYRQKIKDIEYSDTFLGETDFSAKIDSSENKMKLAEAEVKRLMSLPEDAFTEGSDSIQELRKEIFGFQKDIEDLNQAKYDHRKSQYEKLFDSTGDTFYLEKWRTHLDKTYGSELISQEYYNEESEKLNETHYNALISKVDDYISQTEKFNNWKDDNEIEAIKRKQKVIQDSYDKGIISFKRYTDDIKSINEQLYDALEAKHKDFFDRAQKIIDKEKEVLEETRKGFEKQKSAYETTVSTVTSYIDEMVSALQDENSVLDKQIQLQKAYHYRPSNVNPEAQGCAA